MAGHERIEYMDLAKGIGICLIILAHNPLPGMVHSWIYSFHVPLFFIISGYFYKQRSFVELIKKGINQLIIPLLLTHLICFAIRLFFHFHLIPGFPVNPLYQLLAIDDYALPSVWFLYALFLGKIILYISIRYLKSFFILLPIFCFLAVWYCWNYNIVHDLPLHILPSLCAPLFLGIGYILRTRDIPTELPNTCFLLLSVTFLQFNWHYAIDFKYLYFPLGILSVFSSAFSSIALILILKWICSLKHRPEPIFKVMNYMGRYTLVILCFHCIERVLGLSNLLEWLPMYSVGFVKVLLLALIPLIIKRIPLVRSWFNVN